MMGPQVMMGAPMYADQTMMGGNGFFYPESMMGPAMMVPTFQPMTMDPPKPMMGQFNTMAPPQPMPMGPS